MEVIDKTGFSLRKGNMEWLRFTKTLLGQQDAFEPREKLWFKSYQKI